MSLGPSSFTFKNLFLPTKSFLPLLHYLLPFSSLSSSFFFTSFPSSLPVSSTRLTQHIQTHNLPPPSPEEKYNPTYTHFSHKTSSHSLPPTPSLPSFLFTSSSSPSPSSYMAYSTPETHNSPPPSPEETYNPTYTHFSHKTSLLSYSSFAPST